MAMHTLQSTFATGCNSSMDSYPQPAAKNRRVKDGGQSLLEFALMLPLMLLLFTGILEIGRVIYYTIAVNHGATAGAQYGAQSELTAQNAAAMQTQATSDAHVGGMMVSASSGCTCDYGNGTSCTYPIPGAGTCAQISCPSGQVVECVQVTTQATIDPLFHFPGLPASYQANGQAVMRVRR